MNPTDPNQTNPTEGQPANAPQIQSTALPRSAESRFIPSIANPDQPVPQRPTAAATRSQLHLNLLSPNLKLAASSR